MTLEKAINDVIAQKLQDGTVEKLVAEQLEKGITKALDSLFGSYGDVTKVIENQIKSVMVPYLENHDYSEYVTKLDAVMVEVLKNTAMDNTKILENFKELMLPVTEKKMKLSSLFEQYCKYVAENVETNGLEVCYDDDVSYETVQVTMNFETSYKKSSTSS